MSKEKHVVLWKQWWMFPKQMQYTCSCYVSPYTTGRNFGYCCVCLSL